MTLVGVERFVVPRSLIKAGEAAIRRAGRRGNECFALWSGVIDGATFRVLASHVPRQRIPHKDGLIRLHVHSRQCRLEDPRVRLHAADAG